MYDLSQKVRIIYHENKWAKCRFRRIIGKINSKTEFLKKINSLRLIKWVYLPNKVRRDWINLINSEDFDVVIALQGRLSYFLADISSEIKCKTIGWQHNSYEAYLKSKGKYYWGQDLLFESCIPQLDKYIVLNEHDKKMFKKMHNIDCTTIYNPRSFSSDKSACLDKKRFIAAGGFREAKGFDMLIKAFSIFSLYHKDWNLYIFGEGQDRRLLESLIKEENLIGKVHLPGFTVDILSEMLEASAFLLSSRWEGMPMVVLEALEVGLPIISFDITAINPLVTDGQEGIIVPSFDIKQFSEAMRLIAENTDMRKDMGNFAKIKSSTFNKDRIVCQWIELLDEICT